MVSQICKMESMALSIQSEVEIKSPADGFFRRLTKELHQVPNASEKVHGVEVHEGDFEAHGSIKLWSYTIDGRKESFTERIEIDEPNTTMSMVAVGGDILKLYRSYKITYKVIPAGSKKPTVVKITISYEKREEADPPPSNYMQFVVSVIKDIDAHLVSGM